MTTARLRLVAPAPAPTANDDARCMAAIARGDIGALGVLYDRYAPMLLRFAKRAASVADAEDIVQQTFLRVVRVAAAFDPSAPSARPWLFALAARVLQERRRSLHRFGAALMRLSQQPHDTTAPPRVTRLDIDRALDRLSHGKRVVLLLSEIEGFSGEEIAQMLHIPVGTVWTRLHHARREMRSILEEER